MGQSNLVRYSLFTAAVVRRNDSDYSTALHDSDYCMTLTQMTRLYSP